MRVNLSEVQFKKLIKEDLGVSRTALSYTNLIYSQLEPELKEFLETRKSEVFKFKISASEMSYIYQSSMDDFIELPIEEIEITVRFVNSPRKKTTVPFTTGGAAQSIQKEYMKGSYLKEPSFELPKYILEEIDQTIFARMDLVVELRSTYEPSMSEAVLLDFRDTITHECNHLYEFYKRAESGAKQMNVTLSWAGNKNYNIKKEIFNIWKDFMDYVYNSEPYELNAKVQEAYSLRARMPFEEFKNTKYWKGATNLKNFSSDIFVEKLLSKIGELSPGKELSIMSNLYKWFLADYYKWMKAHNENPARFIEKSKHLVDLVEKFQPRINKAGETLLKKYMRLYALEPEV
jgi:hypothetical protein